MRPIKLRYSVENGSLVRALDLRMLDRNHETETAKQREMEYLAKEWGAVV